MRREELSICLSVCLYLSTVKCSTVYICPGFVLFKNVCALLHLRLLQVLHFKGPRVKVCDQCKPLPKAIQSIPISLSFSHLTAKHGDYGQLTI